MILTLKKNSFKFLSTICFPTKKFRAGYLILLAKLDSLPLRLLPPTGICMSGILRYAENVDQPKTALLVVAEADAPQVRAQVAEAAAAHLLLAAAVADAAAAPLIKHILGG